MTAITYVNTHTKAPGLVGNFHVSQQRGYAYESNGRFFHIYGTEVGLWVLSTGLMVSALQRGESLDDWTQKLFGAANQEPITAAPGEVVSGVWRPGLFYQKEVHQALAIDEYAQRSAEQSLRILIEKLDEILLYIEPSVAGLQTYGHKSRELLILACTEVENLWSQYMRLAGAVPYGRAFTTNDYVKLLAPLHLKEYVIGCKLLRNSYSIKPFKNWSATSPTQSLQWYDAYNKTKHDREKYFAEATLEHCIHAIAAAIVMFCVRHSPFSLMGGGSTLAGLFIQHFDISLINPDPKSFYIPAFNLPNDINTEIFCAGLTDYVAPWRSKPLVI